MKDKQRKLKKVLSCVLVGALIAVGVPWNGTVKITEARTEMNDDLKLWFDEPTSEGKTILSAGGFGTTAENNIWQQLTLPIGNSYMGANIYGEVSKEHLTFNEKTLWNGGPSTKRPDYNGGNLINKGANGKALREIQKYFSDGNEGEAARRAREALVGDHSGYGSYQGFADIYMDFHLDREKANNYVRSLDLNTAIASVKFDYEDSTYEREYFTSYKDNILAIKLSTKDNQQGKLNAEVEFPVKEVHKATINAEGDTISVSGELPDNQLKYQGKLKAVSVGGSIKAEGEKLSITNADSIIIYVAAGTDYKNQYPDYRTDQSKEELEKLVQNRIEDAQKKGYNKVKADHIADYSTIFSRVDLDLLQSTPNIPTDDLLSRYKENKNNESYNRYLEVLLFQYGRYLTIQSSRKGTLPSNLQGVWNDRVGDENHVPWGSDYHMNVNLQMNYWPTYAANMAECALPLIDYVDSLREPGRVTAQVYAGIKSDSENPENGFMAHTQNTPFGWTTPGWSFDWGWSPAAVPWILQNCFEYYEYTGDKKFLEEKIYPMLKEEAILYDQMLIEDKKTGRLISSPTFSPEHGPVTNGNAYEQELIWQLYEDVIKAATDLGTDAFLVEKWKKTQARLNPIEIGNSNQIKEWYEETTLGSMGAPGHRHMSHLLGLFPGDLISVDNKEWMDAAIVSLKERGDRSTGWGMGQRINAWARTGDGNQAYKLIQNLFMDGIYPNLWDSHPPFQIDGNFGMTSGVSEMLLQSNMGYINILPALPDVWDSGSFKGLVARGNYEVDVDWANTAASNIKIQSNNGGNCIVQADNIASAVVKTTDGAEVRDVTIISKDRISFDTNKGTSYTISGMAVIPKTPQNLQAY